MNKTILAKTLSYENAGKGANTVYGGTLSFFLAMGDMGLHAEENVKKIETLMKSGSKYMVVDEKLNKLHE